MLYCLAAAILGVVLIAGPLFTLAMLESTVEHSVPSHLREWALQKTHGERYSYGTYLYSNLDVGVFALCFFIALTVYLLFKRVV